VTYNNLKQLASFLDIEGRITIIQDDAMNMDKYNLPKVDLVLTSPHILTLKYIVMKILNPYQHILLIENGLIIS
jgi:hypothetical protein